MSRKKTLPDDVKKICLALVQGYERRRKVAGGDLEQRRLQAVELAAQNIGQDLAEHDRQALARAIFLSCIDGRKYPFERLGVTGMERSCFYDRRAKFLEEIARHLEYIS